jgi:hypothetical protein
MSCLPSRQTSPVERVALHLLHPARSIQDALRWSALIPLTILLYGGLSLQAEPLTWTLRATFADGGTAFGAFTFDSDTGVFSNWNVSTTGGNTTIFFPFHFTPANSGMGIQPNDPSGLTLTFFSHAMFTGPGNHTPENLFFVPTLASRLSDAGGTITIVPGDINRISPLFSVECFDCTPARLVTSGTVTAPTAACSTVPPKVPPGDLFCSCGVNGPGNIYDPTISYCASGVVVPNGDLFCAAGIYGTGYLYDPRTSTCNEGVSIPNGDLFCPAGIYGPGNVYDPKISTCNEGVPVPNGDLFCPAGANGPGGIYNPAAQSCDNGVVVTFGALPPVVPPTQVATTASGLTYSRVSQTFNGTVTVRNIGSSAISGPLQILFTGLPANVTLVNASGSLSGSPFLTVSALASLAPGQSVSVGVQFKNPSNTNINFTIVIYSGSI